MKARKVGEIVYPSCQLLAVNQRPRGNSLVRHARASESVERYFCESMLNCPRQTVGGISYQVKLQAQSIGISLIFGEWGTPMTLLALGHEAWRWNLACGLAGPSRWNRAGFGASERSAAFWRRRHQAREGVIAARRNHQARLAQVEDRNAFAQYALGSRTAGDPGAHFGNWLAPGRGFCAGTEGPRVLAAASIVTQTMGKRAQCASSPSGRLVGPNSRATLAAVIHSQRRRQRHRWRRDSGGRRFMMASSRLGV